MIWILIVVALLLIFLFVYGGLWTKMFGKSASRLDNVIGSTSNDYDKDGVADFADKCPCARSPSGSNEFDGCSKSSPDDNEKIKTCLK